jgi:hypothetical protein
VFVTGSVHQASSPCNVVGWSLHRGAATLLSGTITGTQTAEWSIGQYVTPGQMLYLEIDPEGSISGDSTLVHFTIARGTCGAIGGKYAMTLTTAQGAAYQYALTVGTNGHWSIRGGTGTSCHRGYRGRPVGHVQWGLVVYPGHPRRQFALHRHVIWGTAFWNVVSDVRLASDPQGSDGMGSYVQDLGRTSPHRFWSLGGVVRPTRHCPAGSRPLSASAAGRSAPFRGCARRPGVAAGPGPLRAALRPARFGRARDRPPGRDPQTPGPRPASHAGTPQRPLWTKMNPGRVEESGARVEATLRPTARARRHGGPGPPMS